MTHSFEQFRSVNLWLDPTQIVTKLNLNLVLFEMVVKLKVYGTLLQSIVLWAVQRSVLHFKVL